MNGYNNALKLMEINQVRAITVKYLLRLLLCELTKLYVNTHTHAPPLFLHTHTAERESRQTLRQMYFPSNDNVLIQRGVNTPSILIILDQ